MVASLSSGVQNHLVKESVGDEHGLLLQDTVTEVTRFLSYRDRASLSTIDRSTMTASHHANHDVIKCKKIIRLAREAEIELDHGNGGIPALRSDEGIVQLARETRQDLPASASSEKFAAKFIFLALNNAVKSDDLSARTAQIFAKMILTRSDTYDRSIFTKSGGSTHYSFDETLFSTELFRFLKTEEIFNSTRVEVLKRRIVHGDTVRGFDSAAAEFLNALHKDNLLPSSPELDNEAFQTLVGNAKFRHTRNEKALFALKNVISNPETKAKAERLYKDVTWKNTCDRIGKISEIAAFVLLSASVMSLYAFLAFPIVQHVMFATCLTTTISSIALNIFASTLLHAKHETIPEIGVL